MTNTVATTAAARTAAFDRVQPKARARTGRQDDSRSVRQALDRVRSVPFASATHRAVSDAPFICG